MKDNKIKITVKPDAVRITGHAKSDVCAAVSSIMYTSINVCLAFDPDSLDFRDDGNVVDIRLLNNNFETTVVFDNMITMFKDAAEMADGQVLINDICSNKQNLTRGSHDI